MKHLGFSIPTNPIDSERRVDVCRSVPSVSSACAQTVLTTPLFRDVYGVDPADLGFVWLAGPLSGLLVQARGHSVGGVRGMLLFGIQLTWVVEQGYYYFRGCCGEELAAEVEIVSALTSTSVLVSWWCCWRCC